MDRTLLIILAIFFITICVVSGILINKNSEKQEIQKQNNMYEIYLNKEILGTDLATIISKVVNENEKNRIQKDENGYYIENDENSIKIDLKMITIDKTYQMEEIHSGKIVNFVKHFDSIKFKCTSIEYHKKTGKIKKLVFEELE